MWAAYKEAFALRSVPLETSSVHGAMRRATLSTSRLIERGDWVGRRRAASARALIRGAPAGPSRQLLRRRKTTPQAPPQVWLIVAFDRMRHGRRDHRLANVTSESLAIGSLTQ